MNKKIKFEFRISEAAKEWKNTIPFILELNEYIEAADIARNISNSNNIEVRINVVGSDQGHYFLPKENEHTKP